METPRITVEELGQLVSEVFGFIVLKTRQFEGYDDLSFRVEVASASKNPYVPVPSPDGYILKISHGRYTKHPELIAAQNTVMSFLDGSLDGISVPAPVQTVKGATHQFITLPWKNSDSNASRFIVRLLSFTPGTTLSSLNDGPGKDVLLQVGRLAASLRRVLENFDEPCSQNIPKADGMLWSLEGVCAGFLDPLLVAVEDEKKLQVYQEVIREFTETVAYKKRDLAHSLIHGDVNEGNFVMQKNASGYVLRGLIDFSDLHVTCSVFELVLAVCYMMLECSEKGTVHPVEAGGYVLAGYLGENSLTKAEAEILKIGIEARCTQSLIIGIYTYKYEQQGNEYVLNTQKKGWTVLQMLRSMALEELFQRWNNVLLEVLGKPLLFV